MSGPSGLLASSRQGSRGRGHTGAVAVTKKAACDATDFQVFEVRPPVPVVVVEVGLSSLCDISME